MKKNWPVVVLGVLLVLGLAAPLVTGESTVGFWLEVLVGGLMAGVLYSLVALGFALIFKASGVFNFAQGAMVLFAALSLARMAEVMPLWAALALTAVIMVALAWLVERLVLRPLVNQEGVTLLMATLGIAYFLDGFGQTLWGSDIYKIDLDFQKIDDALDELPVFDFLALGRAPADGLLQDVGLHAQVAPGHDVVQHAHALEQREVLKGARYAHGGDLVRIHVREHAAAKPDGAELRRIDAVDHVQHGAFPGTVGPDDGADLVLAHVEGHFLQRLYAAKGE